LVINYKK